MMMVKRCCMQEFRAHCFSRSNPKNHFLKKNELLRWNKNLQNRFQNSKIMKKNILRKYNLEQPQLYILITFQFLFLQPIHLAATV